MEAKLRNSYIEEVKYQTKMLNNLKRWLKSFIIFSSISLTIILFGPYVHPLLRIVGIILMIISVLGCVIIGLGIKRGQDNVCKIIDYIEK